MCGAEMLRQSSLPILLSPREVLSDHPIPILRGYISRKIEDVIKEVESDFFSYLCPKCGNIQFFKKRGD